MPVENDFSREIVILQTRFRKGKSFGLLCQVLELCVWALRPHSLSLEPCLEFIKTCTTPVLFQHHITVEIQGITPKKGSRFKVLCFCFHGSVDNNLIYYVIESGSINKLSFKKFYLSWISVNLTPLKSYTLKTGPP